uniref:Myosin motor domain-containing protein n=1 Tax=Toxocara canis TaxID=6265 RepID=A0A183U5D1_TOXCA
LRQKPVHEAMELVEQGIPPDGKVASLTIRLPGRYALRQLQTMQLCPARFMAWRAVEALGNSLQRKKMISTGSQGTISSKDADTERKDKCASSSPTSMSSVMSNSSNTPKPSTAAPAATTVQRPALSTMGNTSSTNWTIQLKKDLGIGAKPITHLASREQRSQSVEPQPTPQPAPQSKKASAARPLTSVMQQQPVSQTVEFVSGEDSDGPSALPEYQFGFRLESNASAGDERGGDVCTATSKSRSISRSAKIEVCFRKDKGSLTYFPFLNS